MQPGLPAHHPIGLASDPDSLGGARVSRSSLPLSPQPCQRIRQFQKAEGQLSYFQGVVPAEGTPVALESWKFGSPLLILSFYFRLVLMETILFWQRLVFGPLTKLPEWAQGTFVFKSSFFWKLACQIPFGSCLLVVVAYLGKWGWRWEAAAEPRWKAPDSGTPCYYF